MKRKYFAVKNEFEIVALFEVESHANDHMSERESYDETYSVTHWVETMMISDVELANYKEVAMFDLDICDVLDLLSAYTDPSWSLASDLYYSEHANNHDLTNLFVYDIQDRVEQVFGDTRGVDLFIDPADIMTDCDEDVDHDDSDELIDHNYELLSDLGSRIQQFLDIIEKE
jgi:hypothetical protein